MTLTSGPVVQRGARVPSTFRLTLGGTARALAPLAALGDARCRGGRARSRVRTGAPVGTVSISVSPSRAVGLAGSVGLRLFLAAARDPATGQLLAIETQAVGGARAEGESILLPVTGTSPLVRGAGDAFLPAGTVATTAGVAFAAGAARVELTNLSFVFSGTGALQGLTGAVAGVPQVIATAGAGRRARRRARSARGDRRGTGRAVRLDRHARGDARFHPHRRRAGVGSRRGTVADSPRREVVHAFRSCPRRRRRDVPRRRRPRLGPDDAPDDHRHGRRQHAHRDPAGTLASGPTRIEFVRTAGEPSLSIGALKAGVTVEAFTAALRRSDDEAIGMIDIDAGADLNADEPRWTSTASLQAGSTYVAVNTEGENRAGFEVTPFTVGTTPNGATAPRADATVTMIDLRFTGASTLPRNGTIRFRNTGWAPHFAIAAPLRSGATSAQIGEALKSSRQRRLAQLLDFGNAGEPQALVTRGADTVNQVRFPKAGKWALICFFESHAQQGMYRVVNVR